MRKRIHQSKALDSLEICLHICFFVWNWMDARVLLVACLELLMQKICQQQSSGQLPWAKRASERAHPCLSISASPHCDRSNYWKNYVAVAMKWAVSSFIAPCRTAPMPWDLQPYTETCASFNNEDWWDADTYLQVKPSMRQWKGTFITSHAWTAAKRCRSSIALCTTSTSRKNKVIIFSWSSTHLSSLVTVRAAKRIKPWPEISLKKRLGSGPTSCKAHTSKQ